MTSQYPTALDTLATNKTNGTTSATDHPNHHNDLADAINKIEAELGINPSGSFTTVLARFAAETSVRKTADQSNSTVTPASITDLAFPVTVGGDHFFEFFVPYSSSSTANGVGFSVICPTLGSGGYITYTTDVSGRAANPSAGGAMALTTIPFHSHGEASGGTSGTASDAVTAASTVYLAQITGICSNPSAAGSIQLQWRSETAVASTVKKGAFGRMYLN